MLSNFWARTIALIYIFRENPRSRMKMILEVFLAKAIENLQKYVTVQSGHVSCSRKISDSTYNLKQNSRVSHNVNQCIK